MILLSETSTNKYYGIEVPIDASGIDRVRRNDGQYFLSYFTKELSLPGKWQKVEYIEVGKKQKITILGVIGPEDSIPEELGAEMFEDYYDLGMSDYHRIKNKLEPEGILIENPIEKPKPEEFIDTIYDGFEAVCGPCYDQALKEWQSYKDKLKKIVIIKTEK